jgi:hypothetical protein
VRTFLVSYAAGRLVHQRNQQALVRSAIGSGFDVVRAYGRADLPETFVARHRHILDQPRGAGYWLWKPYLIHACLGHADAGDIVVYVDSGALIRRPLQPVLEQADRFELLLLRTERTNAGSVKRDCFVLTGTDTPDCHRAPHLDASFLAIKNTPENRHFVEAWLELCTDDRILTDKPNECGRPDLPEFVSHRHDQAVLSVLYWRERARLPHHLWARRAMREYVLHHRRRTARLPIPVWWHTPARIRDIAGAGWRAFHRAVGSLRRGRHG